MQLDEFEMKSHGGYYLNNPLNEQSVANTNLSSTTGLVDQNKSHLQIKNHSNYENNEN